ncbi:quinolinate synthase NadA [Desulfovibrio legallii]|uniref:quinolinate synthase n=1 Tax=Desulfovibrio legallii TaxID=571438 RepID=A0A6H3FC98_9BACT|nr:quinolinate synthase NadA [Desulfovibrio legallii]TBH81801.1 quinolinate synthase NadA [Desulfovibrio legallii]
MEDLHAAITRLKERLGASLCIMGHHYQNDAVVRHCDITGDSLELARRVPSVTAEHIVFCGVYFMGESAALLAKPGQHVYLPSLDADCLMSRMTPAPLARKVLEELTAQGRKVVPLAYVNTDLALKAVVGEYGGAVCTSANAATMLRWALDQGDSVLFLPDRHLGDNTATGLGIAPADRHVLRIGSKGLVAPDTQALDRKLLLWPGCCAIHARFEPQDILDMRAAHPGCRVIAHPECREEVVALCDGAGSTSYLIKEAARVASENPGSTLVIATENNLVRRLAARHAGQCDIIPLGHAICGNMAKVTEKKLYDILRRIADGAATPLVVEKALCPPARLSLTRMLQACGL